MKTMKTYVEKVANVSMLLLLILIIVSSYPMNRGVLENFRNILHHKIIHCFIAIFLVGHTGNFICLYKIGFILCISKSLTSLTSLFYTLFFKALQFISFCN